MTRAQSSPGPGWRRFLSLSDTELLAQCSTDRFRASGPGGQKRNKTDSAIRLRHGPTGLEALATESRSQHENRDRALRRLRMTIALHSREAIDLSTYVVPGELAWAIGGGRIAAGRRDARTPAAIAALFDLLEAHGWRVSEAAALLGVSTAALTRFLALEAIVLRAAGERRQAVGLRPLHG